MHNEILTRPDGSDTPPGSFTCCPILTRPGREHQPGIWGGGESHRQSHWGWRRLFQHHHLWRLRCRQSGGIPGSALESLRMSEGARTGKIIYIEDSANIDMGGGTYGTLSLSVPSGITIASNRGWNGSSGGRIYWSMPAVLPHFKHFLVVGNNVTFNGIRLQGPDGRIGTSGQRSTDRRHPLLRQRLDWWWRIARSTTGRMPGSPTTPIGCPDSAVRPRPTSTTTTFTTAAEPGWDMECSVAASSALIEANLFDYCRHAIAGERGYPVIQL